MKKIRKIRILDLWLQLHHVRYFVALRSALLSAYIKYTSQTVWNSSYTTQHLRRSVFRDGWTTPVELITTVWHRRVQTVVEDISSGTTAFTLW